MFQFGKDLMIWKDNYKMIRPVVLPSGDVSLDHSEVLFRFRKSIIKIIKTITFALFFVIKVVRGTSVSRWFRLSEVFPLFMISCSRKIRYVFDNF